MGVGGVPSWEIAFPKPCKDICCGLLCFAQERHLLPHDNGLATHTPSPYTSHIYTCGWYKKQHMSVRWRVYICFVLFFCGHLWVLVTLVGMYKYITVEPLLKDNLEIKTPWLIKTLDWVATPCKYIYLSLWNKCTSLIRTNDLVPRVSAKERFHGKPLSYTVRTLQ